MARAFVFVLAFVLCASAAHGAFTEFYCNASTGSNINAGDKTANGVVTATNGAWSTITNIYTATSGTPFSGVSVGDFASVYTDGATVAVYIARVTAVGGAGLTLTLSTTAKSGTAPTTAATGISCTTGGAWKGPNGASGFPFGFITGAQTDSAGDTPRVNFKNNATYSITAAMTQGNVGPLRFQGYSSSAGDGGRAIIDGGTSGTSYMLFSSTGASSEYFDLGFQNNGATGSANGVSITGQKSILFDVVINSVRGTGLDLSGNGSVLAEIEIYLANQSNTSNLAGLKHSGGNGFYAERVIIHDCNSDGFNLGVGNVPAVLNRVVSDTNTGKGINITGSVPVMVTSCDIYNNVSDGIGSTGSNISFFIANSNFIKNGGYGINLSGPTTKFGILMNNGYGSGTQANSSGTVNSPGSIVETGAITYASGVTPWVDPANGDFRINLAAAKGAGRGVFTQTQASYAGAVGYPDIGAAQHQETASGGVSRTRRGTQ